MAALGGLSRALPKPKYSGFEEELPTNAVSKGPRVVAASSLDGQITLRKNGAPPYGSRTSWKPRGLEDFGDGGAFPECPVVQYPLGMGKSESKGSSNALVLKTGSTVADTIARQGLKNSRTVQSSFADLIPLRARADAGDIDLSRPSEEEVAETKRKTELALMNLVSSASAAQKPKTIKKNKDEPTYVQYTPSDNQMGKQGKASTKIVKIVNRAIDPLAPAQFKHKKIPRGPPTPPPPQLHSPPRKPTAAEQELWRLPPSVSLWKNNKGYTVPLDKRLAADGRGMQDNTINDKFSSFAEALYSADKLAREEVRQRAVMQQKLNERQEEQKAEHLRQLAQKAREERANAGASSRRDRSRSASYSDSSSSEPDSEEERARQREKARQERRQENERELRQSRMGAERKVQMMARESGRDISEKIALGLAKPTASGESMYDSRLFNQSSGFAAGFNEDQAYDKPLFQAQDALNTIYRPKANQEDEGEDEGQTYDKITKVKRFDGFSGGTAEEREGPVRFEKDVAKPGVAAGGAGEDDPFGIGEMIKEETGGKRRYGIQEEEEKRERKRARVSDDED